MDLNTMLPSGERMSEIELETLRSRMRSLFRNISQGLFFLVKIPLLENRKDDTELAMAIDRIVGETKSISFLLSKFVIEICKACNTYKAMNKQIDAEFWPDIIRATRNRLHAKGPFDLSQRLAALVALEVVRARIRHQTSYGIDNGKGQASADPETSLPQGADHLIRHMRENGVNIFAPVLGPKEWYPSNPKVPVSFRVVPSPENKGRKRKGFHRLEEDKRSSDHPHATRLYRITSAQFGVGSRANNRRMFEETISQKDGMTNPIRQIANIRRRAKATAMPLVSQGVNGSTVALPHRPHLPLPGAGNALAIASIPPGSLRPPPARNPPTSRAKRTGEASMAYSNVPNTDRIFNSRRTAASNLFNRRRRIPAPVFTPPPRQITPDRSFSFDNLAKRRKFSHS
jgi:hypothetical protein